MPSTFCHCDVSITLPLGEADFIQPRPIPTSAREILNGAVNTHYQRPARQHRYALAVPASHSVMHCIKRCVTQYEQTELNRPGESGDLDGLFTE